MAIIEAQHFSQIHKGDWPWPHFSPREIASPDTGALVVDTRLLDLLEGIRSFWGAIQITSAYRTPEYNKEIGGAPRSQHILGRAADCVVAYRQQREFGDLAQREGAGCVIEYHHRGFVHVDVRRADVPLRWTEPRQ